MSISAEYSIVRPASTAIFLTVFSAKTLPWVWISVVPLNLLVVYLYNRFLPKIGPQKMMMGFATLAIGVSLFCALFLQRWPEAVFFHFVWKDVYILLMFKQLWSMIHSTVPPSRAKFLYGWLYGMGTVGSVLGSALPSFFAVKMGSESLFFFTLPLYLILMFSYRMALQRSGVQESSFAEDLTADAHPKESLSLIRRSPFLISILLLVVFMQVSAGLMEYTFNAHLEMNILEKDLRTEFCGRITSITNLLSGAFQFAGSFFLIHLFGVKRGHFFIPLCLCLSGLFSWIVPTFAAVSFSFVLLKSIDFSLFGVLREMLYVPLKLDEKFRAKAIIDVFAYRSSKALVSFCVLGLQAFAGIALLSYVNALSIAVFLLWMGVVVFMFKKYAPATL